MPIVFGGHHFGTEVIGNRVRGGTKSFQITATPSEAPIRWGWSYNPMFGLKIEGNTFENGWNPSLLAVEHADVTRGTRGRVYLTATLRDNVFRWTEPVLAAYAKAHRGAVPIGLEIGVKASDDPGNLIVTASGNRREGGRSAVWAKVHRATLDGRPITDGELTDSGATAGAGALRH